MGHAHTWIRDIHMVQWVRGANSSTQTGEKMTMKDWDTPTMNLRSKGNARAHHTAHPLGTYPSGYLPPRYPV